MNQEQASIVELIKQLSLELRKYDFPKLIGQLVAQGDDGPRAIVEAALPMWRMAQQLGEAGNNGVIGFVNQYTGQSGELMRVLNHEGKPTAANDNVFRAMLCSLVVAHGNDPEFTETLSKMGFSVELLAPETAPTIPPGTGEGNRNVH